MNVKWLAAACMLAILPTADVHAGGNDGGKEGHGGLAMVCRDQGLNVESVQVLDLFEGARVYDLPIQFSDEKRFDVQAREALARLAEFDPALHLAGTEELERILQTYRILEKELMLDPTRDATPVVKKAGCYQEQLATYFDDGVLTLDPTLLAHLEKQDGGQTHLAALFVHEVLYKLARGRMGHTSSDTIRPLVAYLFTTGLSPEALRHPFRAVFSTADSGPAEVIRLHPSLKHEPVTIQILSPRGFGEYEVAFFNLGAMEEDRGRILPGVPAEVRAGSNGKFAAEWLAIFLKASIQPHAFTFRVLQGNSIVHSSEIRYAKYLDREGQVSATFIMQFRLIFDPNAPAPIAFERPKADAAVVKKLSEGQDNAGLISRAKELRENAAELRKSYDPANERSAAVLEETAGELEKKANAPGFWTRLYRATRNGVGYVVTVMPAVVTTPLFFGFTLPEGIGMGLRGETEPPKDRSTAAVVGGFATGAVIGIGPLVVGTMAIPAVAPILIGDLFVGGLMGTKCMQAGREAPRSDFCENVVGSMEGIWESSMNAGRSTGAAIGKFFRGIGHAIGRGFSWLF